MSLKIFTEPTVEPITVAEAKAQVRQEESFEDSLIETLIKAARISAETHTRRQFCTAKYDMTLDCFPGEALLGEGLVQRTNQKILIPRPPLQSIDYIKYYDENQVLQTLSPALYTVDISSTECGSVYPIFGEVWPASLPILNAVQVRFTAGYGLAVSVPADIKAAIQLLVAHYYKNREAVIVGTIASPLPLGIERLLNAKKALDWRIVHG